MTDRWRVLHRSRMMRKKKKKGVRVWMMRAAEITFVCFRIHTHARMVQQIITIIFTSCTHHYIHLLYRQRWSRSASYIQRQRRKSKTRTRTNHHAFNSERRNPKHSSAVCTPGRWKQKRLFEREGREGCTSTYHRYDTVQLIIFCFQFAFNKQIIHNILL